MKSVIIIPARLESTRLPRKLLLDQTGKTLIQHTYESASTSQRCERVVAAVDDQELFDVVTGFGGIARMTDRNHKSGTDRVAEAAVAMPEFDVVVNVQGDEPDLPGAAIDLTLQLLEQCPTADVATLATPIRSRKALNDPSCVKVVFNQAGNAMYFSRSPIPHARDWSDSLLLESPPVFYQHVGIYAYRRKFLESISQIIPTRVEQIESLEQLRFLHTGHPIQVGVIEQPIFGIDTPEDYATFVKSRSN